MLLLPFLHRPITPIAIDVVGNVRACFQRGVAAALVAVTDDLILRWQLWHVPTSSHSKGLLTLP